MSEAMPMPNATNQDYSPALKARRAARGIAQGVANLLLIVLAVRDLRRRPESELNGNKKIWWAAAFAPPIGPIAYFIFGRKRTMPLEQAPVSDEQPID